MLQERVKHLWSRAGFGVPLSWQSPWDESQLLSFLLKDAAAHQPIKVADEYSSVLDNPLNSAVMDKSEMQKMRTGYVRSLNHNWYLRMASGKGVLREKMTLFWTNFFSCRSNNPLFVHHLHEIIRKHALGSFRDLLLEVSRSPAMLQFLNNQQNRKAQPNENFAREVMELFTIGRGNYSEQDVREAAKAFTGWTFNLKGEFEFRERVHDAGIKSILGKTGNFRGEDVIHILLEKRETARWIVSRFWKGFISNDPDMKRVNELADRFFDNDYSIHVLLTSVYESDWFYNSKYRGQLIKSPAELMVPLIRDFNIRFENHNVLLGFQKLLGQVLFNPPNVAGWPGGRSWIDSSSLAVRLRLPLLMLKNERPDFESKPDADANNAFRDGNGFKEYKSIADWSVCINLIKGNTDRSIIIEAGELLIAEKLREEIITLGLKYVYGNTREERIRSAVVFLTTLPEYQMC